MTGTPPRRLEGRIAVLAGGAGGIGSAASLRLSAEGAAVMIGDYDGDAAAALAAKITGDGGTARACRFDLGDAASIEALFAAAVEAYGRVDLLHCNGVLTGTMAADSDILDMTVDAWNRTLTVNLTGYFLCTRAALPLMLANGGGAIVYTSSGAAFTGEAVRPAYGASKAGVHALARHVALRWGKAGIRANAVAPGLVLTPPARALPAERLAELLDAGSSTRLGEPEDIAAMVAMLMSSDGEWINGQAIAVNGGYYMH